MEEYEDLKKMLKENMKGRYYISGNSDKSKDKNEKLENVEPDDFNSSKTQSFIQQNNENDDLELNKDQNNFNNLEINNYYENNQKQFVLNQKHTNNPNNIKFNAYNYSENYSCTNYRNQIDNNNDNQENNNSSIESPILHDKKEKFFSSKVYFTLKRLLKLWIQEGYMMKPYLLKKN